MLKNKKLWLIVGGVLILIALLALVGEPGGYVDFSSYNLGP